MSLINDVLRDMDERNALKKLHSEGNRKTIVVPPAVRKKFPPSWLFLLVVGALIGGLAGMLVYDRVLSPADELTARQNAMTQSGQAIVQAPMAQNGSSEPTLHPTPSTPEAEEGTAKTTTDTAAAQAPQAQVGADEQLAITPGQQLETTLPIDEETASPTANTSITTTATTAEADASPQAAQTADAQVIPNTSSSSTNITRSANTVPQAVYVEPGTRLNMRSAPSLQSEIITIINDRTRLTLVDSHPQFHRVALADGMTGWISRRYASLTPYPVTQPVNTPPTAERQAADAQQPAPPNLPPVVRVQDTPEALYRQALRALERDDHAQAEVALHRTLAARPTHSEALDALTALLLRQQRQAELETLLGSLATPRAHLLHARLLAERGEHLQAANLLSRLADHELGAEGFATLGALQQRNGQHALAVNAFQRALSLGHQHASTYAGLAVSLEATDQPDQARSAWLNTLTAGNADPALAAHARRRLGSTATTGD